MSIPAGGKITGIILAGGLSRRMFAAGRSGAGADAEFVSGRSGVNADAEFVSGRSGVNADAEYVSGRSGVNADAPAGDKGLLAIAGKPMLAHVIERLAPQVGTIAINANGDPARFARFGLPVVPDTIGGFVGPLAGVLAGLLWARTHTPAARWIASASADAPFVPPDLVARLRNAVETRGNAIGIAQSGGELQPVIGLWPLALAEDLDAALRGGLRKVLHWTDKHGTVPVAFDHIAIGGEQVDPFFNANTPEELAEARRLMAEMDRS